MAYAWNNRGLSRYRLGDQQGGLADIQRGLELDDRNAYGYRNLGIIRSEEGKLEEARELFLKAKELDPKTHMLDDLLASVTG